MTYLQTPCAHCGRPIGNESYHKYTNGETNEVFYWHNPKCWEATKEIILTEYCWAIFKAQRREVN